MRRNRWKEDGKQPDAWTQAFADGLRSDREFIALRALSLAISFGILARAILLHDLSAGFLFLPLAYDFLFILWGGLLLSWLGVNCPRFRSTSGKPWFPLIATLVIAMGVSLTIALDNNVTHWDRVIPGWKSGWNTAINTGLVWALVFDTAALLYSTVREVLVWRRRRGEFVWSAPMGAYIRLTSLVLLIVPAMFVFAMLEGLLPYLPGNNANAWAMFCFLLVVECGALMIGVKVHKRVLRELELGAFT